MHAYCATSPILALFLLKIAYQRLWKKVAQIQHHHWRLGVEIAPSGSSHCHSQSLYLDPFEEQSIVKQCTTLINLSLLRIRADLLPKKGVSRGDMRRRLLRKGL